MTTPLMRRDLCPLYKAAKGAHPGLLLQRGYHEHREENKEAKGKHIQCVVDQSRIGNFYRRAYSRWKQATTDATRFRCVDLSLETRLFIGLTGGGMLETGCAISHTYGVPYIPGSSVKGVVSAWAREQSDSANDWASVCGELFGAPADRDRPEGLSGVIIFHDAWCVPSSAENPLVPEVVTTHHPDYYRTEGGKPATDFDSPVPNAQIAAQGSFLFVIEGPHAWLELTERMLIAALTDRGAGAKTRAGYGLFQDKVSVRPSVSRQKGDEVKATLFKDDRGRWCGRTDDGQQGTVFAGATVPNDAEVDKTRTLYVRALQPLQFQWEKPVPRRHPERPHRR